MRSSNHSRTTNYRHGKAKHALVALRSNVGRAKPAGGDDAGDEGSGIRLIRHRNALVSERWIFSGKDAEIAKKLVSATLFFFVFLRARRGEPLFPG